MGAESGELETLGGRAGRADASGGGVARVTQARRSGCGRDLPGLRPQVCSTLRLQLRGGRVPNLATLRKPRHHRPGLGDRLFPPRRSRQGITEGASAEPPHSVDASGPGWPSQPFHPGPMPAFPKEGRPQPTRAPSPWPGLATSPEPKSPAPWPPGARAEAAASTSLSGSHLLRDSSAKTPIHSVPRELQRPTPCRPGCDTQ